MRIDRPSVCLDAVDPDERPGDGADDQQWKAFDSALRAPAVSALDLMTLNYRALPPAIIAQLPAHYAWALMCANISQTPADKRFARLGPGARFVAFLELWMDKTHVA